MSSEEKAKVVLLMVALCKMTTEHSSFLIGELKQKPKQDFNNMVRSLDTFVWSVEKNLTEIEKEYLGSITDELHNLITILRKENDIK